jgi:hypothetical protein
MRARNAGFGECRMEDITIVGGNAKELRSYLTPNPQIGGVNHSINISRQVLQYSCEVREYLNHFLGTSSGTCL